MFEREMQKELWDLAQQYPVVTVMGPRQSGKTTLVRGSFPQKPYVNLELIDQRTLALEDPREFLALYPEGAILDEIQRAPELLSYIQGIVDEKQKNGLFILTGSHQLSLHEAVTQSLAGRTALLTLYPLTLGELQKAHYELPLNQQLLSGFYPRIYQEHLNPTKAYSNYFHTYVERDIRQLINIKDLSLFERFIKLCAGRIGNIFQQTSLGNEVGISNHTVQQWLSVLEASYIIVRLQPYYENFGKRIIKAPKIYFTDVGLACYLLGIETESQVQRDPLRGALVENLVILELMKHRRNQGLDPRFYYYRDNHQNEVDLVICQGHELIPVEIKSSQTFHSSFLKGLDYFKQLAPERVPTGYVIYSGELEQSIKGFQLLNYRRATKIFDEKK